MKEQPGYEYLQESYHLSLLLREDALFTVRLQDLLERSEMERFVHFFVPSWKAKGDIVAGTYLGSWLGSVCAALQDCMSRYVAMPVLSLDRLTLQVYEEGGRSRYVFHMKDSETVEVPVNNRAEWCHVLLASFYSEQIRPLLEMAASVTGAPIRELWGQFVTRMYNDHERWLREASSEEHRQRIQDDIQALRNGLEPSAFGLPKNPFDVNIRWIDSPRTPGESFRMRSACCHAYYTDTDHGYCYSCPRMSEEERQVKKQALISAARA